MKPIGAKSFPQVKAGGWCAGLEQSSADEKPEARTFS